MASVIVEIEECDKGTLKKVIAYITIGKCVTLLKTLIIRFFSC